MARVITGIATAVLLIAVGATALLWPTAGATTTDLRGRPVALEEGTTPAPQASADAGAETSRSADARFRVPTVGLDVPLDALSPADGEITPPGFTSAYLVRGVGVTPAHAAEGTMVIVMHSLRDGGVAPGNHLIDVTAKTARVAPGAAIDVGGVDYTVVGSHVVAKTALAHDAALWADEPGRLVVITCLQRPGGGPSRENVVITARLTAGT